MIKATVGRKAFNWELAYSLKGLVHYHRGGEHGSVHGTGTGAELHPGYTG